MSGGHFDHQQYRLDDIAREIQNLIDKNQEKNDWGYAANFSPKIIESFRIAKTTTMLAAAMIQRIDWLVSGDDGPETYQQRLEEETEKILDAENF